jgi:ABC-type glycerol-3-phosphate transport system substrate-binding protein
MKKGAATAISLILSGVLAISGCSSSNPAGAGNSDGKSNQATELTFAIPKSKVDTDNKVYEQFVKEYNSQQNKVHINLQLIDMGDNGSAVRTWVTTQLVGNSAPDIVRSRYIWTQEDYNKGLLNDFNNYLSQKTPYNSGKTWKDTFSPTILKSMTVPGTKDKIAGIPTFALAVRVYYNKDLFKKAGISKLPATWDEFLAMQKQLKDHGITPMAIGFSKQGGDRADWMLRYFSDQTSEYLVPKLDLDKNGSIESNEIVAGVDQGIIDFSKMPWSGIFPILKDWSQYWPKGFNGMTVDDAKEMFLRGDAAMTLDLPSLSRDLQGILNFGVMRVPYLTKKNHPNAEGKYYEVAAGNPDGVYAVPKNASNDKVNAAADFLMYMTSPKVQQQIAEKLYDVPVIVSDSFPDNIQNFLPINEPFKMNLFGPAFSRILYDAIGQYGPQYLDGSLPLDGFTQKLNEAAKKTADELMKSQGWNKSNNYGAGK